MVSHEQPVHSSGCTSNTNTDKTDYSLHYHINCTLNYWSKETANIWPIKQTLPETNLNWTYLLLSASVKVKPTSVEYYCSVDEYFQLKIDKIEQQELLELGIEPTKNGTPTVEVNNESDNDNNSGFRTRYNKYTKYRQEQQEQ